MANLFKTHLWVNTRTGAIESQQQTNILRRLFTKSGVAPMGLRDYRQVSVTISDSKIRAQLEEDQQSTAPLDSQRNHSTTTANLSYGGTSGYTVDRATERSFLRASNVWQKLWGVSFAPV